MFSANISALRKFNGFSQEDLADKVGDKGQIVIPAKARKIFDINAGDSLVVLGDESSGLAIMKASAFLHIADMIRNARGD